MIEKLESKCQKHLPIRRAYKFELNWVQWEMSITGTRYDGDLFGSYD